MHQDISNEFKWYICCSMFTIYLGELECFRGLENPGNTRYCTLISWQSYQKVECSNCYVARVDAMEWFDLNNIFALWNVCLDMHKKYTLSIPVCTIKYKTPHDSLEFFKTFPDRSNLHWLDSDPWARLLERLSWEIDLQLVKQHSNRNKKYKHLRME